MSKLKTITLDIKDISHTRSENNNHIVKAGIKSAKVIKFELKDFDEAFNVRTDTNILHNCMVINHGAEGVVLRVVNISYNHKKV